MYLTDEERIWVCVEFSRKHDTAVVRGTMLEYDFKNIVDGQFRKKFVEIHQIGKPIYIIMGTFNPIAKSRTESGSRRSRWGKKNRIDANNVRASRSAGKRRRTRAGSHKLEGGRGGRGSTTINDCGISQRFFYLRAEKLANKSGNDDTARDTDKYFMF